MLPLNHNSIYLYVCVPYLQITLYLFHDVQVFPVVRRSKLILELQGWLQYTSVFSFPSDSFHLFIISLLFHISHLNMFLTTRMSIIVVSIISVFLSMLVFLLFCVIHYPTFACTSHVDISHPLLSPYNPDNVLGVHSARNVYADVSWRCKSLRVLLSCFSVTSIFFLTFSLYIYQAIYPFLSLPTYPSIYLSAYLSACLSCVYLSIFLMLCYFFLSTCFYLTRNY